MPLHIDDRETTELVAVLAARLRTSEQDAVKELRKLDSSFKDKLDAFRARHPRLAPTGQPAGKQFFDALSGEPD